MPAMAAVPSASSTACGVSTWISNRSAPSASPYVRSSRSQMSTIASTWASEVTLGSVITQPAGSSAPSSMVRSHQVQGPQPAPPGRRLE